MAKCTNCMLDCKNVFISPNSNGPINSAIASNAVARTFYKDSGSLKRSLNYRWKIGHINP